MNRQPHESSTWTTYLDTGGRSEPADPAAFRELTAHPDYPRASAYDPAWVHRNRMGPNVLWIIEALIEVLPLEPGMRVLDLGCGAAISSIFLARELGVQVWAADLWIDPTQNGRRIDEAGVGDRVFPIEAEAHTLPFAHASFDALVSVDSYHYYGTDVRTSYAAQFAAERTSTLSARTDRRRLPMRPRHWRRLLPQRVVGGTRRRRCSPAADDDGWLWRTHAPSEAWDGIPVAESGDGALLLSEHGAQLGFARVTARRTEESTLTFGPGRYTHAARVASYPPIWLIERDGRTKSTWPMWWPAHLPATARSIARRQPVVEIGRVERRRRRAARRAGRSRRARTGRCGTGLRR